MHDILINKEQHEEWHCQMENLKIVITGLFTHGDWKLFLILLILVGGFIAGIVDVVRRIMGITHGPYLPRMYGVFSLWVLCGVIIGIAALGLFRSGNIGVPIFIILLTYFLLMHVFAKYLKNK